MSAGAVHIVLIQFLAFALHFSSAFAFGMFCDDRKVNVVAVVRKVFWNRFRRAIVVAVVGIILSLIHLLVALEHCDRDNVKSDRDIKITMIVKALIMFMVSLFG